ncbi:excisionase [Ammoniphilus oxalaticus]|uniref:Excisionase n=1 Tax=Ammoniphilus oxalaticus TaxID=66863 RepID=A0A419SDC7_9BACL|nr:helix-turn-helix domain-containing protein [Ammoniphilus oxalaticus]RKD21122.1 excisionase [Ammoniphilus oxalaticus]
MLNVQINEKYVNDLLEKAINERLEKLAREKYFLTYNELAEYLNISRPIIEDRLIKNGMKYYRVGSKYLFKKSEIDAFLDDMTESMSATNNDIKFFTRLKGNVEGR